jgi:hypothetical protein
MTIKQLIYHSLPFLRPLGKAYNDWKKKKELKALSAKLELGNLPARKILIYPTPIMRRTPFWHIVHLLNFKITTNIHGDYDLVMNWNDTTFKQPSPQLIEIAKNKQVINLYSTDISKTRVGTVFEQIFGYNTEIDPLTFEGLAVEKGDINAKKSASIVRCPIKERKEGFIYQLVINNIQDENYVSEYRVPVFKDLIPFVYFKFISAKKRFSDVTEKAFIKEATEVFNEEEINKIIALCREMNVEYAELDILRNKDDGKIYIVDVNDTPGSLPGHRKLDEEGIDVFGKGKRQEALLRLAKAFYDKFLV